jgi:peptide methionine sulfoxide reductase MsrB
MPAKEDSGPSIVFDKSELRKRLTLTQYQVTQEHHTEK